MMNVFTTSAIKAYAHNTYIQVFDDVLDNHFDYQHRTEIVKWCMTGLTEFEGKTEREAFDIMKKIQRIQIRKAVKRLDELTHGTFENKLTWWRGF